MGNNHPSLDASLRRAYRLKEELKNCDPAARRHLLAAWKELIIGNLVQLLRVTNDIDALASIDRAIALSQDIVDLEQLSA
jgi:hypothetical protein